MSGVNTNLVSINAQRSLSGTAGALSMAMQRLSSGLRINSAKDDAAGMAISERFTTQIRGINVAVRNANDAISLTQTAEGALASTGSNLQRIRELAVQSANATNSASDRAALQNEAAQLVAEIQRVGTSTTFNGVNLLNGSFANQAFQVGANAGETISISTIVDARTSALGSNVLVADGTVTGGTLAPVASAALSVNAIAAETNLTVTAGGVTSGAISYALNAGADAIASAINTGAGSLGVTATASNSTTLSGLSAAGTVSGTINGQAFSAVISDQNDLSSLVSALNGVAGTSGVTATFTSTSSKSSITLSTTDGRNIVMGDFLNGVTTIDFGGQTLTSGGTDSSVKTGTVSISSPKTLSVQNAAADVFASAGTNNASFSSLAAIDLSTATGSTNALAVLDSALTQVNGGRAELGALQNRFSSTISNLQISAENQSASRSRILDADFAAETSNLSRAQVLQQAGTAMVAQANQLPLGVLALLR
jgi:flagellin